MSLPGTERQEQHNRSSAGNWLVVVLVILVGLLLLRTVGDLLQSRPDYSPRLVTPRGELGADEKSTFDVFRQASPSVVFIRTKEFRRLSYGGAEEQELSSGTGFVWDESGHIITNLHVVVDAIVRDQTQLQVQLSDSTVLDAEFIGAVHQHDVAVLRVDTDPAKLVPITVGTSDDLEVGQKVLAIGNPFGFDRTLSTGVIGGLDRSVATESSGGVLHGLIQTDAAINPGN
ncbi:MAG: trypsin-like peptidase domain-containing protein, partial [Planctomycetaceae bacterium]|nr:trypsin-like peptidase domain-containing protein [Planctomycetaceae bacterium]